MRWDRLFDDLDSQADALAGTELDAEVTERTRIEVTRLGVVDRLRAAVDHPVEVRCVGAGSVHGRLAGVGADWLLVAEPFGREALVPLASVLAIRGLGRWSEVPGTEGRVAGRLGLRQALRGIARDRAAVQLLLTDGTPAAGTVDRVGADFLEVAEHPIGEPRRPSSVIRVTTVPLSALGVLRRW
jgi:hypothetical protein